MWVHQELCPANSVGFAHRMLEFLSFLIEEVQIDHGTEFTYIFMPRVKKPHPFEQFLRGDKAYAYPYCYTKTEWEGREEPPH